VASGIEGIVDAIIDGQNGVLVASGDAQQHAQQIIRIVKSLDAGQKIGKKARTFSLEAFGRPGIADDYIKIYNQAGKET
jgi:glycosyltransferase involved in cell wall biosynthesis